MKCLEVCGGSQLTAQGAVIGGLDAWVYSKPHGQSKRGGDVYYASSCAAVRITRLLLADVSGHGKSVAAVAADLRLLMRRFINRWDQAEFLRLLNQQFSTLSKTGTFATAIISTFFAPSRRLILCNAGHPRPILYRACKKEWNLLGDPSPSMEHCHSRGMILNREAYELSPGAPPGERPGICRHALDTSKSFLLEESGGLAANPSVHCTHRMWLN